MFKFCQDTFKAPQSTRAAREDHSRRLDRELGFRVEEIEAGLLRLALENRPDGHLWTLGQGLHGGSQTWIGLDPQVIQTPYDEMREMFELISPRGDERVVDLGAGYGRMGIFLHGAFTGMDFLGLELVPERVREGQRIFSQFGVRGSLVEADLTHPEFILPAADIYFLYDFGEVPHIRKILDQLSLQAKKKFLLIARGKGTRSLVDLEHPWLSDVFEVIRRENFAIYKSFA